MALSKKDLQFIQAMLGNDANAAQEFFAEEDGIDERVSNEIEKILSRKSVKRLTAKSAQRCPKCKGNNLNFYDTNKTGALTLVEQVVCEECDQQFRIEYKAKRIVKERV